MLKRQISIAPMMDYTDKHFRYLLRLISRHTLLYTEMITTGAILHGNRNKLLNYHAAEHPIALQLGGSDPYHLAECARIGQDYGYDEINLNVGCPSDRVQNGRFGACLMKEPSLVAECVAAMKKAVSIPITIKTRIGVDDLDSYTHLVQFIKQVSQAGCDVFIIHARKAWLQGLSPRENREIPPLRYEVVHQLKADFPQLHISLNGGIKTLQQAHTQLKHIDGVMIGREAYQNPYVLAEVDKLFYGETMPSPSRLETLQKFMPYLLQQLQEGVRLTQISRHLLGLFYGLPGANAWRRHLSERAHKEGSGVEVVQEAASYITEPC